jgi:hypothetical protein
MCDPIKPLAGMDATVKAGEAFSTDGNFLNFSGSYPNGASRLAGGEFAFRFRRRDEKDCSIKEFGRLVLMVLWGHAEDSLSTGDLPLGSLDFLQFDYRRKAESYYILAEWRWPSLFPPAFSSARWDIIHPWVGLGAGVIVTDTQITKDHGLPSEKREKHLTAVVVATGSVGAAFLRVSNLSRTFHAALEGAIRVNGGQVLGIGFEAGLLMGGTLGP